MHNLLRVRPRRLLKVAIITLVSALAAFGLVISRALQVSGIAVIETCTPDGTLRSTHVWFPEPDGELWLEAGTPDNAWFLDIHHNPTVFFAATRRPGRYVAQH